MKRISTGNKRPGLAGPVCDGPHVNELHHRHQHCHDPDAGDILYYSPQNFGVRDVVSGGGIITWTPSTALVERPTDHDHRYRRTGRTATNSFNVAVLHVNTSPVLPAQTNRTINESSTLDRHEYRNRFAAYRHPDLHCCWLPGQRRTSRGRPRGPEASAARLYFTTRVGGQRHAGLSNHNFHGDEVKQRPTHFRRRTSHTNEGKGPASQTQRPIPMFRPTLSYQLVKFRRWARRSSSGRYHHGRPRRPGPGPATNTITTIVTDNGSPNLRDHSFLHRGCERGEFPPSF